MLDSVIVFILSSPAFISHGAGDTKLYNNTLNDWVVVMYFQTADKNEDINFRLNQLTYYRDPIAISRMSALPMAL